MKNFHFLFRPKMIFLYKKHQILCMIRRLDDIGVLPVCIRPSQPDTLIVGVALNRWPPYIT